MVNVKTGEPMTSLNITQNLTRIFKTHFGKSVSTTLLRHIVLTEKFGNINSSLPHGHTHNMHYPRAYTPLSLPMRYNPL